MSTSLRLFVGVPLSGAARAAAADAAAPWRDVAPRLKWVDPGLYHLTLRFLGDCTPAQEGALRDALAPALAALPPVDLRLGAALRLPSGRGARVLALACAEGVEALSAVAREVEAVCRRLGHAPETRPFKAHLTLARARQGESLPPALTGALDAPSQPAWRASEVLLFESVLRPGGPEYRRRQSFPLGGDAATRKDGSTA